MSRTSCGVDMYSGEGLGLDFIAHMQPEIGKATRKVAARLAPQALHDARAAAGRKAAAIRKQNNLTRQANACIVEGENDIG